MRPMPELTVEEEPTDELIPYANNAKIHTSEQVEQICTSIQEFGFNDPVAVWDGPEGPEIIEGHGRVLAAKRLGLEKLPVIRLDHLDDAQRRVTCTALTIGAQNGARAVDAEMVRCAAEELALL